MTQRRCSATLWKCQDSNAVAAVHSWTPAETANLLEYFACTRISRGDVGSFLPLKMNVDYELWQVAQRWAEGPRGDFIGAGMKAVGSEGQLSLFLFQLDRIGTGPEREETRSWAQAAGTGLIKPVTAGEASQLTYDGKSHTLFTTALLSSPPLESVDWHCRRSRKRQLCAHAKRLDVWTPPHNSITVSEIQSSFGALCEDTPIRKRGKSELAAAQWLKAPYLRSTKDDALSQRERLTLLILTAAENTVASDWHGVCLSWGKLVYCFVALLDERHFYLSTHNVAERLEQHLPVGLDHSGGWER